MPGYTDVMPLFERAQALNGPRCYETPLGSEVWNEEEAFDHYKRIAEESTGIFFNEARGRRSVIGLRGAYPGSFEWNGNMPNRFNDSIVLLWRDEEGAHVREFPVNTDTGSHNFGEASSSSLRHNVRYHMVNGQHRGYDALRNDRVGYRVRDDNNANGHWDSDRNGWRPPLGEEDYDRGGSGHNIHMGALEPPLGQAPINRWSAGCQVIPGIANWTEFITNAWTRRGDPVDYFLVDVRDIPHSAWADCPEDGSHRCPLRIDRLPFEAQGDSRLAPSDEFDLYNCSPADESGGEIVYALYVDREGSLRVEVECEEPVDIDIHLLDADDPNACLARGHREFSYEISPGRYLIIADTWADDGVPMPGPYTLRLFWD